MNEAKHWKFDFRYSNGKRYSVCFWAPTLFEATAQAIEYGWSKSRAFIGHRS